MEGAGLEELGDPRPPALPSPELAIPPPSRFTFAFNCSMRGS